MSKILLVRGRSYRGIFKKDPYIEEQLLEAIERGLPIPEIEAIYCGIEALERVKKVPHKRVILCDSMGNEHPNFRELITASDLLEEIYGAIPFSYFKEYGLDLRHIPDELVRKALEKRKPTSLEIISREIKEISPETEIILHSSLPVELFDKGVWDGYLIKTHRE